MTAISTENFDEDLLRVYTRDGLYEPAEREQTRFWDDIKESTDHRPGGRGRFFRLIGNSGHSVGNPTEGGDFPAHNLRDQVEGSVQGAQMASAVEFTLKFLEASKDEGSYSGDAENEGVVQATRDLFTYADILMGCGHGTGRLAVVGQNATATDTIVLSMTLANSEGGFQLRRGQHVDFVNLDTGGSVQVSDVKIVEVDSFGPTPTIVVDQDITVVAGWGIYQTDVYGNDMPNGLRNIVDDGDFASAIFGVNRADASYLNAVVLDNNGGIQDYSLELVRKLIGRIRGQQDMTPTQLRSNEGIVNEHLRLTTADAVYSVTGNAAPSYPTGANQEKLHFQYGETKIPFRIDLNLPARELYALHMPSWRRHTLRKADWVRGTNGKFFHLKPSVDTYSYSVIGSQLLDMNVTCIRLNGQGKLSNLRDRDNAGDA